MISVQAKVDFKVTKLFLLRLYVEGTIVYNKIQLINTYTWDHVL